MLKLYNTLTKQVEEIEKPSKSSASADQLGGSRSAGKDHLNFYSCGPTVYNYAHIGNLRSYIMADMLYRAFKYEGYNPKWVMNITDIDDKTIKGTLAEFGKDATVKDLYNFTEKFYQAFKTDLKKVNVLVDEIEMIRVTDKMTEIQNFIIGLIEKGYAYKADDGVYFSIEKYQKDFGDYGQLVGNSFLEGKKVGARVAVDEYEKDNLSDFVLWKAHNPETDGQIFWDHATLGKGRPGWHIECSAINQVAFKGELVDVHTGGIDLAFPHHTNEIAQSQALLGKGNFVKTWYHCEHLQVDGGRMGKRFNNFYTVKDLDAKVPLAGLALRYLFTQSNFRAQQNFTMESFTGSYKALEKLFNTLESHKVIGENQELQKNFIEQYLAESGNYLCNDLNLAGVVATMWSVLGKAEVNIHTQDEIILKLDEVLGLSLENKPNILQNIEIPEEVQTLAAQRLEARNNKDFKTSDELRGKIEALGYEVKDEAGGQKLKKKI